jgi:glycosyltransferase involved in cell wall biosynthesis
LISILLASYNGEKYIEEQIRSILDQTVQEFILYINDDHSTDKTFDIAQKYAKSFPGKIIVSQSEKNSGDAKYNFMNMMIERKDDYVMLCDQDDVWLPNKIELTLDRMNQLEKQHGKQTPILVHTDLRVVDENLHTVSESFQLMMNANFSRRELKHELIQNTLTGCTVMYNRSMSNLISVEPPYMVMHDWWLMLVASAFGIVDYIDRPTILYRQHEKNSIGAKDVRALFYKANKLLNYKDIKKAIKETYWQAHSLLTVYSQQLQPEQRQLLANYSAIPHMNKFCRWKTILNLGTLKYSVSRKIAQFIFI